MILQEDNKVRCGGLTDFEPRANYTTTIVAAQYSSITVAAIKYASIRSACTRWLGAGLVTTHVLSYSGSQ